MKTVTSIQTKNNQSNNNSLTLKNQKVMKTKKYSISLKALSAVVFAFAFSCIPECTVCNTFPIVKYKFDSRRGKSD